jgi:hypothetical protein
MHPTLMEQVAREHIEDLHRAAARYRLVARRRKPKSDRRTVNAGRLQRAPAH